MDISHESNTNPTAAAVADSAPEPHPPPEPAEPPFQPPDPSKLRLHYCVAAEIQAKFVAYHSAMAQPGATTTYIDQDGNEVTRTLTPRETLRHAQEFLTFGKLSLGQQKLDAAMAKQNGENKPKSLNDLVTPVIKLAGDRMHQEAIALGLDRAAELPKERVSQIFQEEQQKYDAEHPPQSDRCRKKPFAIPPEQRND
jgi:hypothetical protein